MVVPNINALPVAPTRADAQPDYSAKADTFTAALPQFSVQVNTAVSWMADTMAATLDYKNAAASSATAAGGSATQAALKVIAAAEQVALATTQAQNAATSASSAQAYAAAAGAASGAPSLVGNGKKVLTVKADETGVEWKATGQVVGDILFSATPPAANYLPAAGNIYSQSAYPGLFSKLSTSINLELTNPVVKVSPGGFTLSGIAYGAGRFVAVTSNSTVWSSTDGINWSSKSIGFGATTVNFANGKFFIHQDGGSGTYAYSTDGVNWTNSTTLPTTANWGQMAYGAGLYVFIGRAGSQTIITSPDGITWTTRAAVLGGSFYSIVFAFGMFIATVGNNTSYMTSADGITWTLRTLPAIPGGGYDLVFANGILILTAQTPNASVLRSVDGLNWTISNLPEASNAWAGVGAVGNKLVVFSYDLPVMAISNDGIFWYEIATPFPVSWQKSASSPNSIIAVGNTTQYLFQSLYPYDPVTQFATPLIAPPMGTKAYIKYQE